MADQGGDASQHAMSGLMMSTLSEYSDLTTFYDRTASRVAVFSLDHVTHCELPSRSSLKKVAASKVNGLGISSPDDLTLNGLLARLLSGVTGPMRFGKAMNCNQGFRAASILTLQTNLCCYPRIKYLVPSIGGLVAKGMEDFAVGKANQEVGADACGHALKRGLLCGINPSEGKIIAYSMMCRGVELGSAISKVADLKTDRNYQFVDWSPTGFSIFCYKDPKAENGVPDEESGRISEVTEDMAALCKDYEEVAAETCDGEDDYEGEEEEY
eukprot:g4172.t1